MGLYCRITPMWIVIWVVLLAGALAQSQQTGPLRRRQLTAEQEVKLQELWEKYGPDYSAYEKTAMDFPCGQLPKSATVPISVHSLRPGDVKVVGALGDSLTAGSGISAATVVGVLIQNRGLSWSGGGQTSFEDQITLPNILKKYNPDVYGYATANGDEDSRGSMFNVAVIGSTAGDLTDQARKMIDRMKNDPDVDFENDWKVVTVLSGNNDLCSYCDDKETYSLEKFVEHTMAALDILHAELPRTLVNIVEPLNVEIVTELNRGLICSTLHFFICDCAAFPRNEEAELELIHQTNLYQNAVKEIASSGRYDTRDDFAVPDGQPDLNYFAPDCFHLSREGQAAAASALWNNMVEPVGAKKNAWSPGEAIECPSESQPYFFTNKNSNQGAQFLQQTPEGETEDKSEGAASHVSAVGIVAGVAVVAVVAAVVVVVIKRKYRRHFYDPIPS